MLARLRTINDDVSRRYQPDHITAGTLDDTTFLRTILRNKAGLAPDLTQEELQRRGETGDALWHELVPEADAENPEEMRELHIFHDTNGGPEEWRVEEIDSDGEGGCMWRSSLGRMPSSGRAASTIGCKTIPSDAGRPASNCPHHAAGRVRPGLVQMCRHQAPGRPAEACRRVARGDVPLIHLRFRCMACGSCMTDSVVTAKGRAAGDADSSQPVAWLARDICNDPE